jgi:acetylornithine deacetylase/succinyl-diaminopimelate desuccinylase-like protein
MITAYAHALPEPTSSALRRLLDPAQTDTVLDQLGVHSRHFDPLLHNTVNATMVHGGVQVNVIPSEIVLDLDGRLLPGFTFEDMQAELRALLAVEFELETTQYHVNSLYPDMALYDVLAGVLRELDPEGAPVPFVLGAVTDGAYFARLGIQNYGFLPLNMPPDFEYVSTIHAADERVPVAAVEFGTEALYRALQRFSL